MNIVAIIQARMGSTRLLGKVIMDIGGKTMLARVVERTQRAKLLDKILVATTFNSRDNPIVVECKRLDVSLSRGSEEDVLDRYYQAAKIHGAEAVVRVTSDCPFIDPDVIDKVVQAFLNQKPDYASNTIHRTYPRGLDIEVMTMDSLARAWREAAESHQRVHVTPYIYQNPDKFRIIAVNSGVDYSHHRWTVDTQEDLDFVRAVYTRFGNNDKFNWRDVLALLAQEPSLVDINRHIGQKTLEEY